MIGFLVIGDYRFKTPNERALETLRQLIEYGVKHCKISQCYSLRGHRDVVPTECPGQAFYDIIRTWPHY